MMLDHIERSLISIKHGLQQRQTILLFSGVNSNVPFAWPPCSTLLNTRMPTKLTFRVAVFMAMICCLHLLLALPRVIVQATV